MTFLIAGTIGKCLLERKHPFLTKFVLLLNGCLFQYKKPLENYAYVIQGKTRFANIV